MKKNKYREIIMVVIIGILIFPSISLASWWNPFSWFKKTANIAQTIVATPVSASSSNPTVNVTPPDFTNLGYNAPLNILDLYGAKWYECTRYAWGRAYEKTGLKVSFTQNYGRNGGAWYRLVKDLNRGPTPQANSFAVWDNGNYGHVAFVESVDDTSVTVTEANLHLKGEYDGSTTIPISSMQVGSSRNGYGLGTSYKLLGYVYLSN